MEISQSEIEDELLLSVQSIKSMAKSFGNFFEKDEDVTSINIIMDVLINQDLY